MKLYIRLFLVILPLLASCKGEQETTTPTVEPITESVYASGIVKSRNQYQVFSKVNGLVQQVLVDEGDTVKQGEPIIRLVNETSRLSAENARLAAEYAALSANTEKLNELKANIDLAKTKRQHDSLLLVRQRNLWAEQIGTRVELEQKELAYKNSVTAHEAAILRYKDLKKQLNFAARQSQKNLQISRTQVNDFTITSETDGRVYSILKEPGEMVTTQAPVAVIGDADSFMLELQVDEYDIARVKPGQKVLLTLDSYRGQVFEAKVEKINPAMNERSRSFTVEAGFVTSPPALYPNLTTEANIVIQTKEKALTIPRPYLLDGAYVLTEDEEKKKVKTGLKDYEKVEILDGLTKNDVLLKPAQ
ncbi:efflux RND transporter periplasmic adaptor subunit [Botryobacter ruber]|uniref:efflux RND transporter periplasmic adaptor subunit n=1 Tax=Botryobacter ruber TaxID=2171629 RepID=UPI000E0AC57B|nr:HlyD family efflux transporter periplasmic adaptor subunit [Botryobacter ruber]